MDSFLRLTGAALCFVLGASKAWANPQISSDQVGATPTEFRVDESGAANLSVPLALTAGSAGVQPSLSLHYNSRSALGALGVGWSIGGLSSITRCKRGREFGDGTGPFPGIDLRPDRLDAYCLDGARLLASTTNLTNVCPATDGNGKFDGLYIPENDPAVRACAYERPGILGIGLWIVKGRDGSRRRYGSLNFATDGATLLSNFANAALTPRALSWALELSADSVGNTVSYRYQLDRPKGEQLLDRVIYTGKIEIANFFTTAPGCSGRAVCNEVQFSYETMASQGFASARRVDFLSAMSIEQSRLLTEIKVSGPRNNSLLGAATDLVIARRYQLKYQGGGVSPQQPRLLSLEDCAPGPDAQNWACYPSTRFDWGDSVGAPNDAFNPTNPTSYGDLNGALDSRVGDINGDGLQDLVWVKRQSSGGSGQPDLYRVYSALSNGDTLGAARASDVYFYADPAAGNGIASFALYDFSGDGRDDLLLSWREITGYRLTTLLSAAVGNSWNFTTATPVHLTPVIAQPQPLKFALGDFSGDGLPDVLTGMDIYTMSATAPGSTLAYALAATAIPLNISLPPPPGANFAPFSDVLFGGSNETPSLADINGDGRVELIAGQRYTNDASRAVCVPSTDDCPIYWYVLRNAGVVSGSYLMEVDFRLGKGDYYQDNLDCVAGNPRDYQFTDINGDGLAEVAGKKGILNQICDTSAVRPAIWFNRGKSDEQDQNQNRFALPEPVFVQNGPGVSNPLQFLDINGDRRADMMFSLNGTSPTCCPLRAFRFDGATQKFEVNGIDLTIGTLTSPAALVQFIDINGDGALDILRFNASNQLQMGFGARRKGTGPLISKISNGLGAITDIQYAPITQKSVYSREFDAFSLNLGYGSPATDIFAGIYVVSEVNASAPVASNQDATTATRYKYGGARMQFGGRGFLGFR